MFSKLEALEQKFQDLSEKISDSNIISDNEAFKKYCKEHSDLMPIIDKYREYKEINSNIDELKELLNDRPDKELKELAEEELIQNREKLSEVKEELQVLLLPKDPNDSKNVIIEIRSGAGGDEAALFGANLLRMYSRYAENKRWKVEMLSSNITDIGGVKEVSFMIEGNGAYSRFKYESGVHRVQRIPSTESGGRIHTSTVTVAVLPEAEEVEVEINDNDLRIDVFRAGGPGGQCVNTTDSAVRITHLKTGLVVSCQDEKSQHKNKEKAMKILRSRLYELLQEEQNSQIAADRKSQVGTGNRNERIRTYNFPQGRITDHRIGLTLHRIESVLEGDLDELINALTTFYQSSLIAQQ